MMYMHYINDQQKEVSLLLRQPSITGFKIDKGIGFDTLSIHIKPQHDIKDLKFDGYTWCRATNCISNLNEVIEFLNHCEQLWFNNSNAGIQPSQKITKPAKAKKSNQQTNLF